MFDISLLLYALRELMGLIGHVSTGSSFPRPLSAGEEAKAIALALEGDENARNQLIEHNLRLVAHVAKKFSGSGLEMDDIIAIGTIGLIKAVNTYDGKKGSQLGTYAARCIENEILMSIRSARRRKNEVMLQDPVGVDKEGNQISLLDILGTDPDEILEEVDMRMQVERLRTRMRRCLSPRELRIIALRYGLDGQAPRPQREIAAQLGISRSYVSRIEKKALQKLKKDFAPIEE